MSRVRIISTIALLTFASPVCAAPAQCGGKNMLAEMQTAEPLIHQRIMDEAAKTENTEAILWKVEKTGTPPSHLFGTIHMSDKRVTTLSPNAKTALDQSKTVALEIVGATDESMIEAVTKVPELLAYLDGKTLEAQLTEEEFSKVKTVIGKAGMPGEAASLLRPWLVSMLLAITDCQRQQMEAGIQALDSQIEADAKARGANVVGLETAEAQLKAMASVPDDQQIQMLKSGLAYVDKADDMIETLVQLYLSRKLGATMPFQKALSEKVGIKPDAFEGFNKILLSDRNANMRDAAKPLFDKGEAFVAIGALHLSGKNGLVALLREAGYTVTPVE